MKLNLWDKFRQFLAIPVALWVGIEVTEALSGVPLRLILFSLTLTGATIVIVQLL